METELPQTIPELLDRLLEERGLSERAAAMYIGSSPTTVNFWRRGIRIPDPDSCRAIAEWSGLPEDFVLKLAGHLSSAPTPEVEVIPELELVIRSFSPAEQRRWLLPAVELAQTLREAAAGEDQAGDEGQPRPGPYRLRRRRPRR